MYAFVYIPNISIQCDQSVTFVPVFRADHLVSDKTTGVLFPGEDCFSRSQNSLVAWRFFLRRAEPPWAEQLSAWHCNKNYLKHIHDSVIFCLLVSD